MEGLNTLGGFRLGFLCCVKGAECGFGFPWYFTTEGGAASRKRLTVEG